MSLATMNRLGNSRFLHTTESGWHVFVEDVPDPDGRWYRVEYRCLEDGRNATAWIRYNPWGVNPYSYEQSHVSSDGFVCVGKDLSRDHSPYGLEFVVRRTRFWCTGYSCLRQHGYARTCELIPDWRQS